jgi:hypothetical protein
MYTINITLSNTILLHHFPLLIHRLNLHIYPMDMFNIIPMEKVQDYQTNVLLKHPVQEVVVQVLSCFYLILLHSIPAMEQPYRFIHVN